MAKDLKAANTKKGAAVAEAERASEEPANERSKDRSFENKPDGWPSPFSAAFGERVGGQAGRWIWAHPVKSASAALGILSVVAGFYATLIVAGIKYVEFPFIAGKFPQETWVGVEKGIANECGAATSSDLNALLADDTKYAYQLQIWKITRIGKQFVGRQSIKDMTGDPKTEGNSSSDVTGSVNDGAKFIATMGTRTASAVYFLNADQTQSVYIGEQIAHDCATNRNLICPYAITKLETFDTLKNSYKKLLAGKCRPLD